VFFLHDLVRGTHWIERWAMRSKPKLLVANSRFTAASADRIFPGVPHEVYYLPVPAAQALTEEERSKIRTELGATAETIIVVQASRLEPWKGQVEHLRTLAALASDRRWLSVQIGGPQRPHEQRYFAELKRVANELGIADRVRFLGQRTDVGKLLAASDLHLQPNTGPEPFGIAFVEAMQAGLPIVTFGLGALPEIVIPECAVLGHTRADLVAAVRALLDDPQRRRAMGTAARLRAYELCEPARQIPHLSTILKRAALDSSISGI
jgi:glycosyltransferase involved in cell wall biosynthesis